MVVEANWLSLCQECRRAVICARCYSSCTLRSFFSILKNKLIRYADDSTLIAVAPSPCIRVTVAEHWSVTSAGLVRWVVWPMGNEIEWKTKTMIISTSRTMHPHSPQLNIDQTVLKESDDLVILGVTFDSKMTVKMHIRSVSREASQRRSIQF